MTVLVMIWSFLFISSHLFVRLSVPYQLPAWKQKLESSQSLHTLAKAMLFARWQQHIRFGSGLPYAPLKAMLTKISKFSRFQDSVRITPKIESLVVVAMLDIPSKFQKNPSRTFWVILLTHRQTDKQSGKNITSLAEVKKVTWTFTQSWSRS